MTVTKGDAMRVDMVYALDGNAAAGVLADLFGREMTEARLTCGGCGAVAPVGALVVYAHGMGTVVRCRGCDRALLRVAQVRAGYRLDTSGCASPPAE
ncbi:hypothetical protein tb265_18950 [Gemmatimonadetes bacterium T265]|nr:hypothetical protein tb265_18950 [Gemmatimonadetes bacterium T265]